MTVLFLCNLIPDKVGAFEVFLCKLGEALRQNGNSLHVALAGDPIEPVANGLRDAGVTWNVIAGWGAQGGSVRPWKFVLPALRLARELRPGVTVVHFGNELPTFAFGCLLRVLRRRTTLVWQQHQQIASASLLKRLASRIRVLVPVCDFFTAVYEGGLVSMAERGVPQNRINVILNGIADYAPVRKPGWLRSELGLGSDDVLLVNVGWHVPRKRIEWLLRRVSECNRQLGEDDPRVRFIQVGDGPERGALAALVSELGLDNEVHFLGLRNDVREILSEADIMIHAALAETCTYVITEAMAVSKPVVMTIAGAAHDQIATGESGYVLASNDANGFTRCVVELVRDSEKRSRMGSLARIRFEDRFDLSATVKQYVDFYESVAKSR